MQNILLLADAIVTIGAQAIFTRLIVVFASAACTSFDIWSCVYFITAEIMASGQFMEEITFWDGF